jgi:LmbE family N-acetylglucosaminyl deacetylase
MAGVGGEVMHPYQRFVGETVRLLEEGRGLPLGGLEARPRPALADDAPRALIFAPHPDDECLTGGLPLRLLREAGMRVIDVVVTQGSNAGRKAARMEELRGACGFLGFEVLATADGGLDGINPQARARDPGRWQAAVAVVEGILSRQQPRVIFCPHDGDANGTHLGTHLLVMDALGRQPREFTCAVVETEYWAAMATPNLMIESSATDVADLMAATSFHAGEVARNPYHLSLPAWMQDNVRRGSEIVGGQGSAAPAFTFATLYRLRQWRGGKLELTHPGGRALAATDDLTALF